ncbi:MAG: cob(I)yrinic acid a,c-diamide adenosyltransferase [Candidatus Peribacteraceae bacterium]|nr:cob(I)yrinic acid a,c-diamide adenosyltransferase [Candidatus Peribacteraceae bacterium]
MKPSISTGRGDDGSTDLIGGQRISKSSVRMFAIGSIDELNASVGRVLAEGQMPAALRSSLEQIQRTLFAVGADLASPAGSVRLPEAAVQVLEQWGVSLESELPALTRFILPGGCMLAVLLHQARVACRRAERWCVALKESEAVAPAVLLYLNRLGDVLFLAARMANKLAGVEDRLV